MPKSMSADAVVAKGKAAGVQLSTAQVYTIRSNAKHAKTPKAAAAKPVAKTAPAVAAPAAASSAAKQPVNKAALVRSFPTSLPIKEVIVKAKAQGVRLTAKYVHGARAKAKARQEKAAAHGGRKTSVAASPVASRIVPKAKVAASVPVRARASGDLSEQFLNLALDVGLVRAGALLASLRAAARQLTGA